MNIPEHYLPVMPYLIVNNAKSFVDFTKNVFEAKEQLMVPRDNENIMHGELKIYDAVIMFADATQNIKEKPAAMFIYVPSVDSICAAAIKNGAQVTGKPRQEQYGYTAELEDPFGNHWFIVEG